MLDKVGARFWKPTPSATHPANDKQSWGDKYREIDIFDSL